MFGKRIPLFSLLGFQVHIDLSWLFLAFLIIWTLTAGYFPATYPGLAPQTYLALGVLGALGLFLSIILHELSHSLVARHYGMPMGGITLFIFGGIAEMEDEPPTPKAEGLMALAGPLASYVIGGIFLLFHQAGVAAGAAPAIIGLLWYLGIINIVLATFNLIPGFPLDGGRVLRAVLWAWKKDLRAATRIAAGAGGAFAALLVFLGLMSLFGGNIIGGIWWGILGLFLWNISKMNYQTVLVREMLKGQPVRHFMKQGARAVSPELSVGALVNNFIYPDPRPVYPVVADGRLLGCVRMDQVKAFAPGEWGEHKVGELVEECAPENTISPEADVTEALKLLQRGEVDQMLVADGGRLYGTVALQDLLNYVRIRMELEPRRHTG